jgi:hypothetical protein
MKRFSHTIRVPAALIVLSGTLLILAAAKTPQRSQPAAKADTPLKVADVLDRLIQPRFQRFDLGFGVTSRLVRVVGHNAVLLRAETTEEKRLLADADAANRAYVIAFLHCVHVPATAYRNVKGQTVKIPPSLGRGGDRPALRYVAARESARERGGYYQVFNANAAEWQKATLKALPRLMKGEIVNAESGEWLLAMRPVKASRKECLNCHTNSKLGDTLGVMVYGVSKRLSSAG